MSPPSLIFWADKDPKGEETILRVFDGESKLQFAVTRARIEGLSAQSVVKIFTDSINQMLRKFPFVGIVEMQGFWIWSEFSPAKVKWVARTEVERHPFLPIAIKFGSKASSMKGSEISRKDNGIWSIKRSLAVGPSSRLWAIPDEK